MDTVHLLPARLVDEGCGALWPRIWARYKGEPPLEARRLAYATTVSGAQGETVDTALLLRGEHTGAASAHVAMTRGQEHNIAHLVAESLDDARPQWIGVSAATEPTSAPHTPPSGPRRTWRATDRSLPCAAGARSSLRRLGGRRPPEEDFDHRPSAAPTGPGIGF